MDVELATESTEIEISEINADFVARPVDAVRPMEFSNELLLVDRATEIIHVLDPVGSIVWRCLDGKSSLREIVEDLAYVFEAPPDVIRDDVLKMVRDAGAAGLLVGVARPDPVVIEHETGVAVNEELAPFTLPDLDGMSATLEDLRGQSILLVNWSPHCGYCERIAPDLSDMQEPLADKGVRLVFVTSANADANRELFDRTALAATALLREGAEEGFADPFPGMGTPVAYLLDDSGRVAAPLAYGAIEVPALARRAAGLETAPAEGEERSPDGDPASEGGPKYLPTGGGVCGPGAGPSKKPRVWAETSGYEVGEYHVGIRADSAMTDELMARLLAAHRLPTGVRAPDNYSVVLGDGGKGTARGLNLLLQDNRVVVRSRSHRRVLLALAAYLSSLEPPEDGSLPIGSVAALAGRNAFLLPSITLEWLEQMQPRLARLGVRLVDQPYAFVDRERSELVVPEPSVKLDPQVLAAIDEPDLGRSELPRVEPGRYPLRAWYVWGTADAEHQLTSARTVVAALALIARGSQPLDDLVDWLGMLIRQGGLVPLAFTSPDELADALRSELQAVLAGSRT